jgi:RimJ/RimL family protein N-acetyltransferase
LNHRLSRVLRRIGITRWIRLEIAEIYHAEVSSLKTSERLPALYTVRLAGNDDVAALGEYFEKPEIICKRWQRGDSCLMAIADGDIAAALWWMRGPNCFPDDQQTLGSSFRIEEGNFWAYDAKGTRLGAFGSLLMCQRQFLDELGAKQVWGQVDYANKAALKANEAVGFKTAGRILRVSVFGWGVSRQRTTGDRWRSMPARLDGLQICRVPG